MFVLSALLVSAGVAGIAEAQPSQQSSYTSLAGYGQWGGDKCDHKCPSPSKTSKSPSPTPTKASPTPTKASPTATKASPTPTKTKAAVLPVTGTPTGPIAMLGGGVLLAGLALFGARRILARRT